VLKAESFAQERIKIAKTLVRATAEKKAVAPKVESEAPA
jgi:hypothetical protein